MPDPLRLSEMTPGSAREVFAEVPRLLLAAGTLEARGPHLPLGCDTVILQALAEELSARTGIPCTPPIPFGAGGRNEDPAPGAAALTRKALHRILNELIAVWEEVAGVRDITILTAHAADPHLEALSTIRTICQVRVIDIFSVPGLTALRTTHGTNWHGGEVDTSLMLHLRPELVDRSRMPHTAQASALRGAAFFQAIIKHLEGRVRPPAETQTDKLI
jgi:creatinine amidohydrolase